MGELRVYKGGKLSFTITPDSARARAKASTRFTALLFAGFDGFHKDWDFDGRLNADLRIRKSFTIWNPLRLREEDFEINYRIFP